MWDMYYNPFTDLKMSKYEKILRQDIKSINELRSLNDMLVHEFGKQNNLTRSLEEMESKLQHLSNELKDVINGNYWGCWYYGLIFCQRLCLDEFSFAKINVFSLKNSNYFMS